MQHLWAPWRGAYIRSSRKAGGGCFLCDYRKAPKRDRANLVLLRGETCFVVMNRYPYNVGHVIVVSDKAREAYDKHPSFRKTFSSGQYAVFEVDGGDTGYVVPAANEPVSPSVVISTSLGKFVLLQKGKKTYQPLRILGLD